MLFSSIIFLWFFLPAVMLLYTLAPGRTAKNAVLLAFSLLFYSFGEPKYVVLVLTTVLICYTAGRLLLVFDGQERLRKTAVFFSLALELGILGYFKYFNFLAELFDSVAGEGVLSPREIALPLGISFYTFQAITYVVDTYRRKNPVQKNLFHLAVYLCLFPQILSGPIVKYHEIEGQIRERRETLSMTAYGAKRFAYGLAKKVIFANSFGLAADRIFAIPGGELGTLTAWLALVLYSLQIYYDFSGYSDMAIGLGRMFGFRYAENFDYPFLSASATEFWRRWHISLSTWFKDYLYIPLGGNRKGRIRTCLNLFLVFLATGLWHGASTNYVLWGAYYGFFIVLERLWLSKQLERNPYPVFNHLYAMLVLFLGWPLFRTENLASAVSLLRTLLIPSRGLWDPRIFVNTKVLVLMVLGILLCGPVQTLFPKLKKQLFDEERVSAFDIAVMAALLFLSTTAVVSSTYSAFIYFKF